MNAFRLTGDFVHLFAIILLVSKILWHRSSAGISGKSQLLLALVFISRYTDIYMYYISLYNISFKIIFISLTCITVFLIYVVFRKTYQRSLDTFWCTLLIITASLLAYVNTRAPTFIETSWTFSQFLEAVAMLPQFLMIYKTKKVQKVLFFYLTLLGTYRILYIINWVHRYLMEYYQDGISSTSGCFQMVPYCIFWCMCATSGIAITDEDEGSWLSSNLTSVNEGNIFVITLPEKSEKITSDRKPLIKEEEGDLKSETV